VTEPTLAAVSIAAKVLGEGNGSQTVVKIMKLINQEFLKLSTVCKIGIVVTAVTEIILLTLRTVKFVK
jgi:hypothetical protein